MSPEPEREALLEFLARVSKPGRDLAGVADDANLVRLDILDSFAVIQIIHHLEERYGLDLPALGVDPADLASIGGMLNAIRRTRE